MFAKSSNVTTRFSEETSNFTGSTVRGNAPVESNLTKQRKRASKSIIKLAKEKGVSVDQVVTNILKESSGDLARFVAAHGETPNTDPLLLAVQAAFIRANDVAIIAKAIGTSDTDALREVEAAENEAIDMGNMDAASVLPYDVQAALAFVMDKASDSHSKRTGRGSMAALVQSARSVSGADTYDFNAASILYIPGGNGPAGSSSPGGSKLGNVSEPDNYDIDITKITAPTTGSINTSNTASTSGASIFDIIDKIVGGITAVGGVVNQGAATTGGILDSVKNVGSDIGKDSISKALKENAPMIIGGIALIVLIIVIAIYASRRK